MSSSRSIYVGSPDESLSKTIDGSVQEWPNAEIAWARGAWGGMIISAAGFAVVAAVVVAAANDPTAETSYEPVWYRPYGVHHHGSFNFAALTCSISSSLQRASPRHQRRPVHYLVLLIEEAGSPEAFQMALREGGGWGVY